MIIIILILVLLLSFSIHIYFLLLYILRAQKKHLKGFINTAISNITIAGSIMFLLVYKPSLIREVNAAMMLWLMSGLIFVITLVVKVRLFMRMYRNIRDPKNFHLNFFKKKVLNKDAVSKVDISVFFMTMPFFLMAGAYFLARLINLIIYGKL